MSHVKSGLRMTALNEIFTKLLKRVKIKSKRNQKKKRLDKQKVKEKVGGLPLTTFTSQISSVHQSVSFVC